VVVFTGLGVVLGVGFVVGFVGLGVVVLFGLGVVLIGLDVVVAGAPCPSILMSAHP